MAWVSFAAPVLAALAIIAVLGLPSAFALRLRGFALAAVAVPAAFAVLAVANIAAPVVGVGWSVAVPVALSAGLAVVLFLLRRWIGAPPPRKTSPAGQRPRGTRSWRDLWIGLGSTAIGGAVIAVSLAVAMRSPDALSQTFDANFHYNAVRYVLDSQSGSPFTMSLTTPGSTSFYPTLWHAFVALVVQLTGAAIPTATNAVLIVVAAVVWPVGAVALGRSVAGPSTRVALISGAAVAAFPNFPLFLAGYGVLYPNLFALALAPFVLVGALQLLALGPARRAIAIPSGARWLLLLGAFGAAVLAHPNAVHALLVWAALPVGWAALRALRGRPVSDVGGSRMPITPRPLRAALAVVGVVALVAVIVVAWYVGRTGDNVWSGFYGPRSGLVQLFDGTPHLEGSAWAVSLLALVGAVVAWRRRAMRWVLGAAAALAFFYYIADSFPLAPWRTFFLNPWYSDPRRLASLVPFGLLPLVVLGASAIWTVARATRGTARGRWFAGALAVLMLVGVGQTGALTAEKIVKNSYAGQPAELQLLSDDEAALLSRLGDEVGPDDLIAGNPFNGSSLAYALADREVLFPHAGGSYSDDAYELVDSLVSDPPRACHAAAAEGVDFVLDFGTQLVLEPTIERAQPFKNMKHLDDSPILTEVDREGDAVLYRLTCP